MSSASQFTIQAVDSTSFFEGAWFAPVAPCCKEPSSAFLFMPIVDAFSARVRAGDGDFDSRTFPFGVLIGVSGRVATSGVPARLEGKPWIPSARSLRAIVLEVANSAWHVAWNIYDNRSEQVK